MTKPRKKIKKRVPFPLSLHRKAGRLHAFIAITDRDSGNRNCFTVYKIRLDGDKAAKIIGRELSLARLRRVVDKLIREGA